MLGAWEGPASQDHLGRDAEEKVIIPPPHLQQQGRLRQHGLLQLAGVGQRTPVDLDDDVAILDAPSADRRDTWSPTAPPGPGPVGAQEEFTAPV